jgi:hypothetical protein
VACLLVVVFLCLLYLGLLKKNVNCSIVQLPGCLHEFNILRPSVFNFPVDFPNEGSRKDLILCFVTSFSKCLFD